MSASSSRARVYGALTAGIFALGWSAILIRMADAPPLAIAAYRMLGGAILLLPFTSKNLLAVWRELPVRQRLLWIASALFLTLHFALWIESLRHTSVASSVLLVTTNPIFAGLGGWLILGEREGRNFWAGVGCALLGCALLVWSDTRVWEGSALGNTLALGGAVMASGYLLCGRKLRGSIPLGPYVTLCYGLSGVLLALCGRRQGAAPDGIPRGYLGAVRGDGPGAHPDRAYVGKFCPRTPVTGQGCPHNYGGASGGYRARLVAPGGAPDANPCNFGGFDACGHYLGRAPPEGGENGMRIALLT